MFRRIGRYTTSWIRDFELTELKQRKQGSKGLKHCAAPYSAHHGQYLIDQDYVVETSAARLGKLEIVVRLCDIWL